MDSEGRDWREAVTAAMFVLTVLVAVAWQTRTIEAQSMSVHVTQDFTPSVRTSEAQPTLHPGAIVAATLASLAPSAAVSAQQIPLQSPQAKVRIEGVVMNANSVNPLKVRT